MAAIVKVALTDYRGVPVHFHTSADITYFNKHKLTGFRSLWSKTADDGLLQGNTVEDAIVALSTRINAMIEYNEELENQVMEMKNEFAAIEKAFGSSTIMLTQASFIKTEYFEPENFQVTAKDEPPYTATLKVPAVKSTDIVIINPVQHTDVTRAQAQLESYNCISNLIIGDGVITLKCYEMKPLTGIPIQIVIFREKNK